MSILALGHLEMGDRVFLNHWTWIMFLAEAMSCLPGFVGKTPSSWGWRCIVGSGDPLRKCLQQTGRGAWAINDVGRSIIHGSRHVPFNVADRREEETRPSQGECRELEACPAATSSLMR